MGVFTRRLKLLIFLLIHKILLVNYLCSEEININTARQEFLLGNYEKSILIASQIDNNEAKIFQSRAISVYAHFFKKGKTAKDDYLFAYQIAKKIIVKDPGNDEAYVEAAHALGRYGQEIGIMNAITEGIADRVKRYLNKALALNSENVIANLSKGIWHAEIINQAGKVLAKVIYGADINQARNHFINAYNFNNKEIGVLYELAYGYHLLDSDEDKNLSLNYIEDLLSKDASAHIDNLYQKKALKLKKEINSEN